MRALAQYHFGHLPVWIDGNAYFNGAEVWQHENHYWKDDETPVTVSLDEVDGKMVLRTNAGEALKDFTGGIITTDTLGKAFEPEQRFESPDGTDITFDRDYFGAHRGLRAQPGPFATLLPEQVVWG